MRPNLDFWSQQVKYKDHVLFIPCNQEISNHDIFEKYNIEEIPTFLFFKNNEQVEPRVTGFDIRRTKIEAIMDRLVNATT
jgi:thioredoxin-related protein